MSRLWVDANIVLRFITKEPEDMAERAARAGTMPSLGWIRSPEHLRDLV